MINVLFTKAGIAQHEPGRDRKLFSMHSTRVAAVCYLLRAALTETVFKALADWTSDQVRRYRRRLILDPALVEPWPIYNLESDSYVDAQTYAPPAKHLRPGPGPAANVPSHPASNSNLASVSGPETVKPRRGCPGGLGAGARGATPTRGGGTLRRSGRRARGPWVAR